MTTLSSIKKKGRITVKDKFELIRHLVESDAGFESDCVQLNIIQGRKVDESTRILAELVSRIYRIVHPHKDCPHADWEKETEESIKLLKIGERIR